MVLEMTAKAGIRSTATAQHAAPFRQQSTIATLPAALADVALIDAETCAAAGSMSVSWWHEEVRAGRAPKPAVQRPRCTRWAISVVADFWRRFAEDGSADTEAAEAMKAKLSKASAKAQALRAVSTATA